MVSRVLALMAVTLTVFEKLKGVFAFQFEPHRLVKKQLLQLHCMEDNIHRLINYLIYYF